MNLIRNTIARDLHDDIGATLSSISFYAEAIKKRIEQNKMEEANSILDQMSLSARQTVESMSDIVWLVNPSNDKLNNLTSRIFEYAEKALLAKNINFIFKNDVQNTSHLDALIRRDLFLICKEAVNNALKYSEAKNVEIHIKLNNKFIHLIIIDDGKGFDYEKMKYGNGILNMKVRAENINAKIDISTGLNKGTRIALECLWKI